MKNASAKTIEALMLGLIIFASSIFRGGNRNLAMAMLLLMALVLLSLILADVLSSKHGWVEIERHRSGQPLQSSWWRMAAILFLVASPVFVALIQTSPELSHLLSKFKIGGFESKIWLEVSANGNMSSGTISLIPEATATSAMCGTIVTIVFLATLRLDAKVLARIVFIWICVAVLQIVVVCFQLVGGREAWAYFNSDFRHARAFIGTFNSRNTLAGYFAACFPLIVWYCFHCRRSAWSSQSVKSAAFAIALAVLTIVILLSFGLQSRGGLISFFISATFTLAIVGLHQIRRSKTRIAALQVVIGVLVLFGASLLVGWDIVSQRFSVNDSIRQQLFGSAWHGALEMLPFGSGLGSFGSVYPMFQPAELVGYFSLAHNDYIQFIFEIGFFSLILAASALVLLMSSLQRLYGAPDLGSDLGDDRSLQLFALSSLVALSIHSTVEFNMHIPFMAIFCAFIFGITIRIPDGRRSAQIPISP